MVAARGAPCGLPDWDLDLDPPTPQLERIASKVTMDWAGLLNPSLVRNANEMVFETLASAAGTVDTSCRRYRITTGSVLAVVVAEGLAQTAPDRDLQGPVVGFDPPVWTEAAAETSMDSGGTFAVDSTNTPPDKTAHGSGCQWLHLSQSHKHQKGRLRHPHDLPRYLAIWC